MIHTSVAARDRRPVPGAKSFDGGIIFCGTRAGVRKWQRAPGALCAPLDLDPGSLSWPVAGGDIVVLTHGAPSDFTLRLIQALIADGAKLIVNITEGRASFHTQPPEFPQ